MSNLLENNIALICPRQHKETAGALITDTIAGHKTVSAFDINSIFPLYIYPSKEEKDKKRRGNLMMLFEPEEEFTTRKPNIHPDVRKMLAEAYGKEPRPENIFYYIYAVLYSNIYREKYAEFLRIDFPRVPFTSDKKLFLELGALGERLADLHMLKSSELNPPVARYQGSGSDKVDKVKYDEAQQRVYINTEKYFEGITTEVWNYHIGGYQVLHKYLKDRKGRNMDDPVHYCRIATAISKTIELQKEIDELYEGVEENIITKERE